MNAAKKKTKIRKNHEAEIQKLNKKLKNIETELSAENKEYNRIRQELKYARRKKTGQGAELLEERCGQLERSILRLTEYRTDCKNRLQALYFGDSEILNDLPPLPEKTLKLDKKEAAEINIDRINVGDLLYHKTYGICIAFWKKGNEIEVCFGNEFVLKIGNKDFYAKNWFTITNRINPGTFKYNPPISQIVFSSSFSPAQQKFQDYLISQMKLLENKLRCIRILRTEELIRQYASQAVSIVHQIKRAEKAFRLSPEDFCPEKYQVVDDVWTVNNALHSIAKDSSQTKMTPGIIQTIRYKSDADTLYVYSGRIRCIKDKHSMVCINAHIETASGETAVLNVNCCLNCNRFYISYDEYLRYMEKYKSLLTHIILVDENGNSNLSNSLAVESTLKLCGYSVSQEKGFTSAERAALLAGIIHGKIVSKPDVIQHLNWLIRMNGKKTENFITKEKWEEDLAFVRNLDVENQANRKIDKVVPYDTKHKNR